MSVPLRLALPVVVLVALSAVAASAQQKDKYPRVNTTAIYVVDPAWPQKPADFYWGHVPGVAVDAKDNVYVFTRSTPPVQVYDAKGKYLRGWGDKEIKSAHHIRFDHQGNVWTT